MLVELMVKVSARSANSTFRLKVRRHTHTHMHACSRACARACARGASSPTPWQARRRRAHFRGVLACCSKHRGWQHLAITSLAPASASELGASTEQASPETVAKSSSVRAAPKIFPAAARYLRTCGVSAVQINTVTADLLFRFCGRHNSCRTNASGVERLPKSNINPNWCNAPMRAKFGKVEPKGLANTWPNLANFGRISADDRLPEHLFDTRCARRCSKCLNRRNSQGARPSRRRAPNRRRRTR